VDKGISETELTDFWGKYSEGKDYHALVHHCADVAACFEALLSQPLINKRLARAGYLDSLDSVLVSRLAVLVFFHDLGKIATGFQAKVLSCSNGWPASFGHIKPVTALIFSGPRENAWKNEALCLEDMVSWGGEAVTALLLASLSHHGSPVELEVGRAHDYRNQWEDRGHLSPKSEAAEFGRLAKLWFAPAFEGGGDSDEQLPSNSEFQHAFAGLVALADWIGSSEYFHFVPKKDDNYIHQARETAHKVVSAIGLSVEQQRAVFKPLDRLSDYFTGFENLRPLQQAVYDVPTDQNAIVLEAETGAGKTEAALLRFLKLYAAGEVDSLYFALPTRAAAVQLHGRVCKFVERMFTSHAPEVVLAVPGYLQAGRASGDRMPGYVVEWDDAPSEQILAARWAAHSAKRYLAAQIAVGTIDQAMYSALAVKHAHMRASCLTRSLLVIDELHASDTYMQVIVERVVEQQRDVGGHVFMMSATLGAEARTQWLSHDEHEHLAPEKSTAIDVPYPAVSYADVGGVVSVPIHQTGRDKSVQLELLLSDHENICAVALQAAREGAKVLVIRNTGY